MKTKLHKKSLQSLTALSCGDSYGSYYESDGLLGCKLDINKLPDKPITKRVTDDTKMATILLRHYLRYKTLDIEKLVLSYRFWAKEDGAKDGIGLHTSAILLNKKIDKNSQGNGALMRNIPFGIEVFENGKNFEKAVDLMNKDSSITHKNETIFLANRICLDIAINRIQASEKLEYKKLLSQLHYGSSAWVIHTIFIIFEALKHTSNFLDGFKYIVSMGGDTDTNCAIYGAIKGYLDDINDELGIADFLPNHKLYKKC